MHLRDDNAIQTTFSNGSRFVIPLFTTDQQRTEYNLSVSFARAKKLYINSVISLSMSLLVVRVFSKFISTQ